MEDVKIPHGCIRLMCDNCIITDTYLENVGFKCKTCGHDSAKDSTMFEDDWEAHLKNLRTLAEAEELVAVLKDATEAFVKGWDSTWNSNSPEQVNFEQPELIDTDKYFSGEM